MTVKDGAGKPEEPFRLTWLRQIATPEMPRPPRQVNVPIIEAALTQSGETLELLADEFRAQEAQGSVSTR